MVAKLLSRIGKSYWMKLICEESERGVVPRFLFHLNLFRPPFFDSEFNSVVDLI